MIGFSDGAIDELDISTTDPAALNNGTSLAAIKLRRIRNSDGIAVRQIFVDPIQEKIYAVREKAGLIRCSIDSCENSTFFTPNSPNFIQNIAGDPWNG